MYTMFQENLESIESLYLNEKIKHSCYVMLSLCYSGNQQKL